MNDQPSPGKGEIPQSVQLAIAVSGFAWLAAAVVGFLQWQEIKDGEQVGFDALATVAPWFAGAMGLSIVAAFYVYGDGARESLPGPAWGNKSVAPPKRSDAAEETPES